MREGWKSAKLGEVSEMIKRGIAPKYTDPGGVCVINQKCIRGHSINYGLARRHNVDVKRVPQERFIQLGDVLVNSTGTGTLGRVAQVRSEPNEPSTVDTHVTIVRPAAGLFHHDFFGYMLIKIEDEIISSGEGTSGQTELPRQKLENQFFVSFPESIEEQKRIVAILDEAFAGIDTVVANTEKNLANAQDLFNSYLGNVYEKLKDSAGEVEIYSACESVTDCINKTAPKVDEPTPFKMIRTTNVRNGFVSLDFVKYVTEDVYEKWTRRQVPMSGDIILTREAPMGEVGLLDTDEKVFLGQRLVSYRADRTKLVPEFLLYAFQSPYMQRQIHSFASGSTVQHMRVPDCKKLMLPLPDLDTQWGVVERLKILRDEVSRVESNYQQKLTALAELKQSLLHKAFSGELTTERIETAVEEVTA